MTNEQQWNNAMNNEQQWNNEARALIAAVGIAIARHILRHERVARHREQNHEQHIGQPARAEYRTG